MVGPVLKKEVKPKYTPEALQGQIEGSVWLECVVTVNGVCSDIKVIRGLDPRYGLNEAAISALKKWRFTPGTKDNQPVPVLFTIEMNFAMDPPPSRTLRWTNITGMSGCGPGTGIQCPVVKQNVNPTYTREAEEANIQGTVLLECVVTPGGACSDIKVLKSLDAEHGLDREAFKALSQWRFTPGKKGNQPVPVLITVEMHFALKYPAPR